MRLLLTIGLLLGVAGGAFAQQPGLGTVIGSSGCWPVTSRERVVVVMDEGPDRKGTLLCMGPEEIMLTGSESLPLSTVRKISKTRDSVLDGVLKGAAVGLVIYAFCGGDCDGDYVLRATAAYAFIGGTMDALQGNNTTIYRREPRPPVAFRLRF